MRYNSSPVDRFDNNPFAYCIHKTKQKKTVCIIKCKYFLKIIIFYFWVELEEDYYLSDSYFSRRKNVRFYRSVKTKRIIKREHIPL